MPLSSDLNNQSQLAHRIPPALEVVGISKSYSAQLGLFGRRHLRPAVRSATLKIMPKEMFALVGESGSGKTTLGKIIVGLERPDAGSIHLGGDIMSDSITGYFKPAAARQIGFIFQDPSSSLNPRMRVADLIGEGLRLRRVSRQEQMKRTLESLEMVGLRKSDLIKYPHEFSGGQRQRIAIARAIAVKPRFLIADEATSALDVSVQLQILNLLLDLRETLGLAMIFITHNIAVVEYLCDRVAIMCSGEIVEQGSTQDVLAKPEHPYTRQLMAAIPRI